MAQPDAAPQQSTSSGDDKGGRKPTQVGEIFETKRIDTPLDKVTREQTGKRSYSRTDRKRGRYIKSQPAGNKTDDIAFDATLRAAAPFQRERAETDEGDMALKLRMTDLATKDPRAPNRKPDPLCGGCQLVNGGQRTHGGDQGRHL